MFVWEIRQIILCEINKLFKPQIKKKLPTVLALSIYVFCLANVDVFWLFTVACSISFMQICVSFWEM